MALASELTFITRRPGDLGHPVQVEVVGQDDAAPGAGDGHQLGVDLGDLGQRLVDDLDRDAVLLLQAGHDLEAAPPTCPARRVRAVGDPLELLEHDTRHHERALQEAGFGDVSDPAVDDRAGVDDDRRRTPARPVGLLATPLEHTHGLGRNDQVVALGDRQTGHAEAQRDRDAERQPGPERRRERRQRKPEQEAHEKPDEEAQDGGHELGSRELLDPVDQPCGGDDRQVGQDGEADDEPGHEPGGDQGARIGALPEDARPARHEREADEEPQGGADQADDADHGP